MVSHAGLAPPALTIGPLGGLDPVLGVLAVALVNFALGAVLLRYADPDRTREVVRDARAEPAESVLNGVIGIGMLFIVAFSLTAFAFGSVLTVALTVLLVSLLLVGTPLGTAAVGSAIPLAILATPDSIGAWIAQYLPGGGGDEGGPGEGEQPGEPAAAAPSDGMRPNGGSPAPRIHHRLMAGIEAHDPWFGLAVGSLLFGLVGLVPVVGGIAMFLVASPGIGALLKRVGSLVAA